MVTVSQPARGISRYFENRFGVHAAGARPEAFRPARPEGSDGGTTTTAMTFAGWIVAIDPGDTNDASQMPIAPISR